MGIKDMGGFAPILLAASVFSAPPAQILPGVRKRSITNIISSHWHLDHRWRR